MTETQELALARAVFYLLIQAADYGHADEKMLAVSRLVDAFPKLADESLQMAYDREDADESIKFLAHVLSKMQLRCQQQGHAWEDIPDSSTSGREGIQTLHQRCIWCKSIR